MKIINLYAEGDTQEEIGKKFNISTVRVSQILRKNVAILKPSIEWEKSKRIAWYKRNLRNNPTSKKDPADLMENLRKEIEGDGEKGIKSITQIVLKISGERNNVSPRNTIEISSASGATENTSLA